MGLIRLFTDPPDRRWRFTVPYILSWWVFFAGVAGLVLGLTLFAVIPAMLILLWGPLFWPIIKYTSPKMIYGKAELERLELELGIIDEAEAQKNTAKTGCDPVCLGQECCKLTNTGTCWAYVHRSVNRPKRSRGWQAYDSL